MKKILYIIIIINFFTINLKAEIAYIDINFILNNSEVGKYLNLHIEDIRNKNISNFKNIENNLLSREKELIAQQNVLDEQEFKKKLNLLTNEVEQYRIKKESSLNNLKKVKIDNTKKILKILNPIITKYVNENNISLVIPKKNIIVGKKNLDITHKITKMLNNQAKTIDLSNE
tara:strand:+ start:388 stop:906 length:519 start_codon:yes stop_codon:yes gene_type:complete